jgi:hypothetical protein
LSAFKKSSHIQAVCTNVLSVGGMSGSYSNLALYPSTTSYIFGWQSRGALNITENTWLGDGYTYCNPRWLNHNVAIATMSSKDTLTGEQATSTVGADEGDLQVNWITYSSTEDHQNVHVAAASSDVAMVTWETLTSPDCQPVPLGCSGTYAGTSFQLVDANGTLIGSTTVSTDVFVSGDIATMADGRLCWPYVDMTWDLSQTLSSGTPVSKMSFACATVDGSSSNATTTASTSAASSAAASTSVAASSSAVAAVASSSSAAVEATSVAAVASSSSVAAVAAVASSSSAAVEATSVAAVATSAASTSAAADSTSAVVQVVSSVAAAASSVEAASSVAPQATTASAAGASASDVSASGGQFSTGPNSFAGSDDDDDCEF